jgi:DNA-binding Lrp family transcriptional regulator
MMKKAEVLSILEHNAKLSNQEIADMAGISADEVEKIIREANEEKLILGYKATINWNKLNQQYVFAYIEAKITPQKDVGFDAIAESICKFEETIDVCLMSGAMDLLILVKGKSIRDIADFVTQKLSTVDGVTSTASHFMLKYYKDDGIIVSQRENNLRQSLVL